MLSAETTVTVQFYDVDPMNVVWHGNYVRFLEQARCALLDHIGYNYPQMKESGYVFPIVDLRVKYVGPLRFGQTATVTATLEEYENRVRISYRVRDQAGAVVTKAETTQVAVLAETGELCLECPAVLVDKVRAAL